MVFLLGSDSLVQENSDGEINNKFIKHIYQI